MNQIQLVIFDWAGTTIDYGCFAPIQGFIEGFKSIGIEITKEMARGPMGLSKLEHTRAIAEMLSNKPTEEEILSAYDVFEKTLFENIGQHCDLKEYVLEVVEYLRKEGVFIGSTTGYTSEMMKIVLQNAAAQGYCPDFCIAPDQTKKGRPHPYMIWENLIHFDIPDSRMAVKVGDTVADIKEGKNANCWTVGIIIGSSELGLSVEEVAFLSEEELIAEKERVRVAYYNAGADYIIDDLHELPAVIEDINRKMKQNAPRKLLTPGPLTTKESVKYAMMTDHCTWDDEYKEITRSVLNDIANIVANNTYATILLQGSGTYAVEAMINSLTKRKDKILFLVNGEYGNRMLKIAENAGKYFAYLSFDHDKPIDVEIVGKKLKQDKDIDIVCFVHCETTTGVINPLEDIVKLCKLFDKKVFIDVMSSFAAYPIDMVALEIDALAASSNKCLEGLPGLSFVIVKKRLIEKREGRSLSHSLDLYDQYEGLYKDNGKFRFTSPTNILLALRQAIDEFHKEGGVIARQKRYQNNHRILTEGLTSLGFQAIVKPEHQSYIITTFTLGALSFPLLYAALKEKGFVIYPGKMTALPTFRIGNIGDVYEEDMLGLVQAVEHYITSVSLHKKHSVKKYLNL